MRINTEKSIKLAKTLHTKYGSWQKIKEMAEYIDNKYVLRKMK